MIRQRINCYTDGSCPVNPGPGGYAYVIALGSGPDANFLECSGYERKATNNTMELRAGIECMRHLIKLKKNTHIVAIHSDSRYVVDGMQVHRHNWALHDFTNAERPIKNSHMWREAHELAEQFYKLRFKWLRGHVGHYYNERCDAMAGAAVKYGNRNGE